MVSNMGKTHCVVTELVVSHIDGTHSVSGVTRPALRDLVVTRSL